MGCVAMLYLIGKAKSLAKGEWLWRPIAALLQSILPKRDLKNVACATTMLRILFEEVPGNIVVRSVNSVAAWFHSLDGAVSLPNSVVRINLTTCPPCE